MSAGAKTTTTAMEALAATKPSELQQLSFVTLPVSECTLLHNVLTKVKCELNPVDLHKLKAFKTTKNGEHEHFVPGSGGSGVVIEPPNNNGDNANKKDMLKSGAPVVFMCDPSRLCGLCAEHALWIVVVLPKCPMTFRSKMPLLFLWLL